MGLFVLIVVIMAILSSVVLFSLWLVALACLVVAMAKMASLEAEQHEVPWEFIVWRRLFAVALGVSLVFTIGVISLLVFLVSKI